MTTQSVRREVESAQGYQDQLVPALMEDWAPKVAGAAGIRAGDRVLDVACGTGVLTREAARRAGAEERVTGLDLSPAMLAVAARLNPGIRWQQGSAEALPYPDRTFDAVVSQFGLMFVPDPVLALREMWRVLAPGGRLAVAVWASLDETPAYAAQTALVERLAGRQAGEMLRTPFNLGDPNRLAQLCRSAGIAGADVRLTDGVGRFPSIRSLMEVDLRNWLPTLGVVLDPGLIEEILRQAETTLAPHVTRSGSEVTFASPAVLVTAQAPGDAV
jgi:ubiquinone/menaquinone biosynthesis C-methylase UbiE